MIAKTLKQIVDELNVYLTGIYPAFLQQAQLKEGASGKSGSPPHIAVTLINVEEDKVYKNHLNPLPNRPDNSVDPIHPLGGIPTMRVNLYVLFAFNPISPTDGYADSLTRLSHVLAYFQGLPYQEITIPATTTALAKTFNLEINYHNISLEDSNNMWSNLGGEQRPCAMYQMRMLEIEPTRHPELVAVIQYDPLISNPDVDVHGNPIDHHTIQNL